MGNGEGTILILSSCIQTSEWTDQNTPRRSLSVNMSMSDPFAVPCRRIRKQVRFRDRLYGRDVGAQEMPSRLVAKLCAVAPIRD